MITAMEDTGLPFAKYAFALSEQHEEYFRGRQLEDVKANKFRTLATESIQSQAGIEASDDIDLEEFLRRYFNEELR